MLEVEIRGRAKKETGTELSLKIVEPFSLFFIEEGGDLRVGMDRNGLGGGLACNFVP